MKIIDVEIYISQFIDFFEKNPNDLLVLIGEVKKNEFYSKVKEQCVQNYKNNDDVTLTRQQIIDIVVEIKKDSKTFVNVKTFDGLFQKTKFGTFSLN
jgi:hypothetical protein